MSDELRVPYLNPIHAGFSMLNGVNGDLDDLFALCDKLDEYDRNQLFGLVYPIYYVDAKEFDLDEAVMKDQYDRFKKTCSKLPIMEHFLVWNIVMQVLNVHRDWADEANVEENIKSIRGFAKFTKERGNPSEKWEMMADERENNLKGELALSRNRYDTFCANVVKPLMEMKPKYD